MKKNNNKGFTLAELLIVVAIIAVLVAIAIPVFNTQLEKSRDAVTISNYRAAYAQAQASYLSNNNAKAAVTEGNVVFTPASDSGNATVVVKNVAAKGQVDGFSNIEDQLEVAIPADMGNKTNGNADGEFDVTFDYDLDTSTGAITITSSCAASAAAVTP